MKAIKRRAYSAPSHERNSDSWDYWCWKSIYGTIPGQGYYSWNWERGSTTNLSWGLNRTHG